MLRLFLEYEYSDEDTITQEDAWVVISSFFEDKGLVTQQLESFNEFVENSMQELVDEEGNLTLDQYDQHTGMDRDETVSTSRMGPEGGSGVTTSSPSPSSSLSVGTRFRSGRSTCPRRP